MGIIQGQQCKYYLVLQAAAKIFGGERKCPRSILYDGKSSDASTKSEPTPYNRSLLCETQTNTCTADLQQSTSRQKAEQKTPAAFRLPFARTTAPLRRSSSTDCSWPPGPMDMKEEYACTFCRGADLTTIIILSLYVYDLAGRVFTFTYMTTL